MSTWKLPKTNADKRALKSKIKDLNTLFTEIRSLVGDDTLSNILGAAQNRLIRLSSSDIQDHRTKDCNHVIFHDNGEFSTCPLCYSKVYE